MLTLPMPAGIRYKTVSSALIRLFLRQAQHYGLDEQAFCALTGITHADLHAHDGRLSGDKHLRMLRLGDGWPLRLEDFPASLEALYINFPELAALWSVCETPRQGVVSYVENRCLIGEVDSVLLTQGPDRVMLDYINEAGMARSGASALGNFNIVICILRHLLAGLPAEISIDLQGELTAPRSAVEARFGVRVRYHQPQNRLLCVSPALDAPNRQHNPLAQRYLQDSVARERRQLASQRSFLQQVEWQLKARMCSAPLSGDCEYALAEVCQHFAISRWTLLRRLKEEGDTFQSVWARVRGEEAQRLLAETGYSIGEISDRLGFVSQSSLSRFFRAQWGLSPLQFRARRPPVHHSMAPLSVASVDSAAVSRDEVPTFS